MTLPLKLRTAASVPGIDALAAWLNEQGEPFEVDPPSTFELRAIPVQLTRTEDGATAHITLTPSANLTRLLRLVFDLSDYLGADVHHAGSPIGRSQLWLTLAEDQDRLRIGAALDRAAAQNQRDDVLNGLWTLLSTLGLGRDLRWDATQTRVVEVIEDPNGSADTDLTQAPDDPTLHIIAWRWLAETWPSLAD